MYHSDIMLLLSTLTFNIVQKKDIDTYKNDKDKKNQKDIDQNLNNNNDDQSVKGAQTENSEKDHESIMTERLEKAYYNNLEENKKRAEAVRQGMKHAWDSYVKYAWGNDELKPSSRTSRHWFFMGLTIVDSLDTLYLMDLKEEYKKGRDWVANQQNHHKQTNEYISVFESFIRLVGGYLTMYELTGQKDKMYLEKAKDIGDILLDAWDTPGMAFPKPHLNVFKRETSTHPDKPHCLILADVGTTFLEYTHLSKVTGNPIYAEKAEKIREAMDSIPKKREGLYSIWLKDDASGFCTDEYSAGAMADSFYEYLVKMWIYTGKQNEDYRRMYLESANGILDNLYFVSKRGEAYITQLNYGNPSHNMEHLMCFAGGMFGLGAASKITRNEAENERHWNAAIELTKTCVMTYLNTQSGIGPEVTHFSDDGRMTPQLSHYILRPEVVESVFVMYRLTGDPIYQEWGWTIFEAIEKHCRIESGYAGLQDVNNPGRGNDDLQQSFFMAETLKYLYLLFADPSIVPLDKYVFNTEAHPIPVTKIRS
ncbi:hypothetical protein SAMD00019534_098030 [Acytostelium subglobosum LB1]|uniref:hypothetical protein n=1 Tax=Acytostelium subglobosum LB1 TaxID=1410327 RepID=UPI000644A56A|nr:hypothetical protein SAMD00019534_098030 [Acytostelium subglobosum LB1]GAM26628.1 hypothetical protein SAMD00019534_098030 [Acytostelium subglobosum LB1]|eukprot:XP_012750289.1 hypothetical protein SAMD00019534_098030 [Acytostelium subglobosum LB1]